MLKTHPFKDYLFFGLDNLEFTIGAVREFFCIYNELELSGLDYDNSSLAYVDIMDVDFKYSKIHAKGYDYGIKFETIIDGRIVDCFAVLIGKEVFNGKNKSRNKVIFYSSFFVVENMLPFTLNEFYGFVFKSGLLHRVDIALDVEHTIKHLNNTVFQGVNFFSQIGHDKKHPEFSQTYYIGNPQSSANSRHIFRIYDKLLDSHKKRKFFLYPHLIKKENVRRIELELRREECKRFHNYYDIHDILTNQKNVVENIFFEYINKHIKKEKYLLQKGDLKLKKYTNVRTDLKSTFQELGFLPKDYLAQLYGRVKTVHENCGKKGLLQLMHGLKIDETTKEIVSIMNYEYSLGLLDYHIQFLKDNGYRPSLINKILKKNLNNKITLKTKLGKK